MARTLRSSTATAVTGDLPRTMRHTRVTAPLHVVAAVWRNGRDPATLPGSEPKLVPRHVPPKPEKAAACHGAQPDVPFVKF